MSDLKVYLDQFAKLRRAPGPVWTTATKELAPHKPFLLLAVLDLVARGVLNSSFIDIHGDLNELNDLFTAYWRRVVPLSQKSSIAFPFSRLHNEPFWKLIPVPGKEITPAVINNISTVNQLREVSQGAKLDEDLFNLMTGPELRSSLRTVLLRANFSAEAQSNLNEQIAVNMRAFEYSRELEQLSHKPLDKQTIRESDVTGDVRDQGFRRAVIKAYGHRCALCGVRIITPEGHTVVDAAHIQPWSIGHNDDIRNGLALCKMCHWSFDKGMLGISDEFTVITSRQISMNPNLPGSILTLADRKIIPPKDEALWPAKEYITWHRANVLI